MFNLSFITGGNRSKEIRRVEEKLFSFYLVYSCPPLLLSPFHVAVLDVDGFLFSFAGHKKRTVPWELHLIDYNQESHLRGPYLDDKILDFGLEECVTP